MIKIGDRVAYPGQVKLQLGSEIVLEEGVVVDVISGKVVQIVFTKPDSIMVSERLRRDYYVEGDSVSTVVPL